jgi:hypothetical protein
LPEIPESGAEASMFAPNNFKGLAIWFDSHTPNPGVVAHEALHATSHILSVSGIEHTFETEEAYCYHQEWLVKAIERRIDRRAR